MSTTIKRFTVAIAMSIAFASANAQPAGQQQQAFNPIKDVVPFSDRDTYLVQVFFKFSCPVCRAYHLALDNWGKTLPRPFHLEFEPVLEADATGQSISLDSLIGSVMYWSMHDVATPEQMDVFAENAYELVQDDNQGTNPKAWMKAVGESGVSQKSFTQGFAQERTNRTRAQRQVHYSPTATPTLVICGKWMITPDSTSGDQNMFFKLANGLVSKCMVEHGIKG